MQIRKAIPEDAEEIMGIYRQAQACLKVQGVNQWQNGYPNPETADADIASGNAFVCIADEETGAVFVLSFEREKTYDRIYGGRWLRPGRYGVIHRIAVADAFKRRGFGSVIFRHAEQACVSRGVHSIRIDTHRDNVPMQALLKKNGFRYCGIIYLSDGGERLAFEKLF